MTVREQGVVLPLYITMLILINYWFIPAELLDHDAATNYWTREEQPVRSVNTDTFFKLEIRLKVHR